MVRISLAQIAAADKTNEIGTVLDLLGKLVVEGHVFTTDALLTQRELAGEILDRDGGFVFIVKRNQPQLYNDIEILFEPPRPRLKGESWATAETPDAGHGRIERRRLQASTKLNEYVDWPGVEQVFARAPSYRQENGQGHYPDCLRYHQSQKRKLMPSN